MSRIACVWIPDLPLVAHLRLDPDAADHPLALTDGRSARSTVIARTAPAAPARVGCGMTATPARAACVPRPRPREGGAAGALGRPFRRTAGSAAGGGVPASPRRRGGETAATGAGRGRRAARLPPGAPDLRRRAPARLRNRPPRAIV